MRLSKKEFALLRALAEEPTRVFTREELLRGVWGYPSLGATRTLDSHASRLRSKLSAGGARFVVNVWGVGYRLIDGGVGVMTARPGSAAGWRRRAVARGGVWLRRRALGARMEAVARACHELRGPITAARLGLELGRAAGQAVGRRSCGRSSSSWAGPRSRSRTSTRRRHGRARRAARSGPVDVRRAAGRLGRGRGGRRPRPPGQRCGCAGTDGAAPVRGDRLRLAQATGNLIANAIEHGGRRACSVRGSVERGDRRAGSRCSDDGAGLPAPVAELTAGAARHGARGAGWPWASAIALPAAGRRLAAAAADRAAAPGEAAARPATRWALRPPGCSRPSVTGPAVPTHTRPDGTAAGSATLGRAGTAGLHALVQRGAHVASARPSQPPDRLCSDGRFRADRTAAGAPAVGRAVGVGLHCGR